MRKQQGNRALRKLADELGTRRERRFPTAAEAAKMRARLAEIYSESMHRVYTYGGAKVSIVGSGSAPSRTHGTNVSPEPCIVVYYGSK